MCGLLGYIGEDKPDLSDSLKLIEHRGPDFLGVYEKEQALIYHQRLMINDLSPAGNQPFVSSEAVVTVNGEIYNCNDLREKLEGDYFFRSSSDSEVVLHGFAEWGVEGLLEKLDGMFAFSIYLPKEKKLILAVDRIGIKPLFYRQSSEGFGYCSELNGLLAYKKDLLAHDKTAIFDFLTYGYVPPPKTAFLNVKRLRPGSYVTFQIGESNIFEKTYWSPKIRPGKFKSLKDAQTQFRKLLEESVKEQLNSDVEIGSLLSGGIDSSTVTYYAQRQSNARIKAFNISFPGSDKDEQRYARLTADCVGANLISIPASVELTLDRATELNRLYGEPFGDTSTFPTSDVFGLAKDHVTVVLSGDGGDELFAGYTRYKRIKKRLFASKFLKLIPTPIVALISKIQSLFGSNVCLLTLKESELFDLYAELMYSVKASEIESFRNVLEIDEDYDRFWHWRDNYSAELSLCRALMMLDLRCYLPNDILTKVDRCSMRFTLEANKRFLIRL